MVHRVPPGVTSDHRSIINCCELLGTNQKQAKLIKSNLTNSPSTIFTEMFKNIV